jgi:hypothetical protein
MRNSIEKRGMRVGERGKERREGKRREREREERGKKKREGKGKRRPRDSRSRSETCYRGKRDLLGDPETAGLVIFST